MYRDGMKTYLHIMFNSEGVTPSEIKNQLMNMGFQATKGNYDFVFDWGKEQASIDELVFFCRQGSYDIKKMQGEFYY
jgi:hypothetical protein